MVRSKLDYACFVYDCASESAKRQLDPVHHASLRVVTGAFRTSPSSSLLVDSHELPLACRREMLGMRYAIKLRQFPAHPTYPYIFSRPLLAQFEITPLKCSPFCMRMQDLFARSGIPLRRVMRVDAPTSPPWQYVRPRVDLSLTDARKADVLPIEARSRTAELLHSYAGYRLIYTDGSKTTEGVGCAFVTERDTRTFSLPVYTSVYTSELVAISKALSFIEVSEEVLHLILTDSLSSLLALRSSFSTHPLIQDILSRITSIHRAGKSVQLCWVPSHVGIAGNELADAAARRAASAPCTRRVVLPARDFYPAVRAFVQRQWQEAWDAEPGNKLRAVKPTLESWSSSSRRQTRRGNSLPATHWPYVCYSWIPPPWRGATLLPVLWSSTHCTARSDHVSTARTQQKELPRSNSTQRAAPPRSW